MSPPDFEDETGMPPVMDRQPQQLMQSDRRPFTLSELFRDARMVALLVSALFGGPLVGGVVTSYNDEQQTEPIQQALDEAQAVDARILEALKQQNEKLGEVDLRVSDVAREQLEVKVSINGDPTADNRPGIKGLLYQHERKLDSLRKDMLQIKRRDSARDDATGLSKKLDADAPLERDEIWER